MIPKLAIEKAIEGGYYDFPFLLMTAPYDKVYLEGEKVVAKKSKDGWDSTANAFLKDLNYYKIALDPTFWQALGKALGWQGGKSLDYFGNVEEWQYKQMRFNFLLMSGVDIETGGDTEKFWEEILSA